MGMSLQQSKNRIKSIRSTKKITKAMELVSTSKLKRAKDIHFKMTPFENEFQNLMSSVVCNIQDRQYPYFLTNNQSEKKLYIIINSSLGLCGGYDSNVHHYVEDHVDKNNADVIVLGTKGYSFLKNKGYNIIAFYEELPQFNIKEKLSTELARFVQEQFDKKQYHSVYMIYTKFINSLTFDPSTIQLLPLTKQENSKKFKKELQIEPTVYEVLDSMIPFYLTTTIKKHLFEAMLSEQASRRIAMENATDNAFELENKLMLEYNKARQAMITQEISEISGSADALN